MKEEIKKFECEKHVVDCYGNYIGKAIGMVKKDDGKYYYIVIDNNGIKDTTIVENDEYFRLFDCGSIDYGFFVGYLLAMGKRAMQRKYFSHVDQELFDLGELLEQAGKEKMLNNLK